MSPSPSPTVGDYVNTIQRVATDAGLVQRRKVVYFGPDFRVVDNPTAPGGARTEVSLAMPTVKDTFVASGLAPFQTMKTSAGTFFSASCEIHPGATTGTYYLLVIDAAAPPGDGALAAGTLLAAVGVDHVNGVRDYQTIAADAGGFAVANGICIVLSTTRPSKTIVGSNWLWVNGSFT